MIRGCQAQRTCDDLASLEPLALALPLGLALLLALGLALLAFGLPALLAAQLLDGVLGHVGRGARRQRHNAPQRVVGRRLDGGGCRLSHRFGPSRKKGKKNDDDNDDGGGGDNDDEGDDVDDGEEEEEEEEEERKKKERKK